MTRLISQTPRLSLRASFASAEEAGEWLAGNPVELIFLDIEMPGLSGMNLAAVIPDHTHVIFTTAYSEYAVRAYDVGAIDYLLKPITTARFAKAVSRALAAIPAADPITIRSDRQNIRLSPAEIVYIEGMKDYVRIHCSDRRIVSRLTIKALLDMLPASDFVRIHKSYIVNLKFVGAFDLSAVEMTLPPQLCSESPTISLPLGASYRSEFEKRWR